MWLSANFVCSARIGSAWAIDDQGMLCIIVMCSAAHLSLAAILVITRRLRGHGSGGPNHCQHQAPARRRRLLQTFHAILKLINEVTNPSHRLAALRLWPAVCASRACAASRAVDGPKSRELQFDLSRVSPASSTSSSSSIDDAVDLVLSPSRRAPNSMPRGQCCWDCAAACSRRLRGFKSSSVGRLQTSTHACVWFHLFVVLFADRS
jgi:hypothetical protein